MVALVRTILALTILTALAAPAPAAILTLPFVGDIEHPDLDPFHVLGPAPAAAPEPSAEPAKPMKKHMRHKKKMKM